jgi:arylsulfatase A-like enzyme
MRRRTLLKAMAGGALLQASPPNVVLINCDDLGYGDLECYGSRISTPNINRMANDGALFRSFCSVSPVCSPSRAALMTGRYPTRVGVPTVLNPNDGQGLSESATTIGQVFKGAGYQTMCIGKWHLGTQPQHLPTSRGFDEYYGIPYSNDMAPSVLMHNTTVIEQPVNLASLTERYTEQATAFMQRAKDKPFFLYLAHSAPHLPLVVSTRCRGKSSLGSYGDTLVELDLSTGQILQALKENGLDDNTLVIFTSDNGPWFEGSAGRLRGRKGQTYEGGMRVPFLARFPGQIPAGRVVEGMATAMDVMPTLARLCGGTLPLPPLDGVDVWPMMTGERETVEREAFLYFDYWDLQCARLGKWKLHLSRHNTFPWTPEPAGGRFNLPLPKPELYDMEQDAEESYDLADQYPQIVEQIRARVEELRWSFPEQVQWAWRETFSRRVLPTAPGALPILRTD